jgi:hypothetical protein
MLAIESAVLFNEIFNCSPPLSYVAIQQSPLPIIYNNHKENELCCCRRSLFYVAVPALLLRGVTAAAVIDGGALFPVDF